MPRIEIVPNPARADQSVAIRLADLAPHRRVLLRASVRDDLNGPWESHAVFEADAHGCVDVPTCTPVAGTYNRADPMGLLWSMALPHDYPQPGLYQNSLSPHTVTLTLEASGTPVASAQLVRQFCAPEVVRMPVRERGLVGTFFRPPGADRYPAVISFPGSDGGLDERRAALLASHGFASLALAYFHAEHLPTELVRIPLEYFETAIAWLRTHDAVDGDRIGVIGQSRGGELALLLGATFRAIKAVVAYVPSGFVHWGIAFGSMEQVESSWTHHGQPLPFFPYRRAHFAYLYNAEAGALRLAQGYVDNYAWALRTHSADVERAAIPVERTNGPLLLLSGIDDHGWPCSMYADLVMERLAKHRHVHPSNHVTYEDAGHCSRPPCLPTTSYQLYHHVRGVTFAFGGTPRGNAHMEADGWKQACDFLHRALT